MIAQRRYFHLDKITLISAHSLPEPASDLLEKIIGYQTILYKLISITLKLPEKRVSNSLKMFLNESKDKLRFFTMTFEEITAQIPIFYTGKNLSKTPTIALPSKLPELAVLKEILTSTNVLYDLYIQLECNLQKSASEVFFKDLIQKSLIFYKQTNVVLNGYLRTFMGQ